MSVAAMSAVWRQSKAATPSALLILLALADWADDDGYCYPSHRAIAQKARTSRATVKRVMRAAELRGELERAPRGHTQPTPKEFVGQTGFRPTTMYRITLDPHVQLGSPRTGFTVNSVQPDRELGSNARAYKRKYTSEDPSEESTSRARASHHRHAFCPLGGDGFCVPDFLHGELRAMLGGHESAFDLLSWYVAMDARRRQEQPTVGDPIGWWRDGLRAEMQRRGWLVPRGALPDRRALRPAAYDEWRCPHTPHCGHPSRCAQLIALEQARTAS